MALAALLGSIAWLHPATGQLALMVFSVAAGTYLLIGLVAAARRSMRIKGDFRLPWGDILLYAVQLTVIWWLPFVIYRRRNYTLLIGGFYDRAVRLLFRAGLVAALGTAIWLPARAVEQHQAAADYLVRLAAVQAARQDQLHATGPTRWDEPAVIQVARSAPRRRPIDDVPDGSGWSPRRPAAGANAPPLPQPQPQRAVRPDADGMASLVGGPDPRTLVDPNDAAAAVWRTTANLHRLAFAVLRYQGRHQDRPPAALDDFAPLLARTDLLTSPFEPDGDGAGYVFVAANAGPGPPAVMFYDAAELRQTGNTHVVYSHSGRVVAITRDALGRQSGVTLP